MMILAVTGLSLYFILNGNRSKFVNDSIEIVMLLTMIIATIWAYYSFYKLDLNPHPISLLDDLLLLICLPAFFIYCLLNCISGISGQDLDASVLSHTLQVKFGHSEKHTEFEKNLPHCFYIQTMRKIFPNFVCFPESPNFKFKSYKSNKY